MGARQLWTVRVIKACLSALLPNSERRLRAPPELQLRRCSRRFVWCLWCLSRAEIDAIYAKELKQLRRVKSCRLPIFMRFSCKLLKRW